MYAALYHYSYVVFINPVFDYAHHYYFDRPLLVYVYLYGVTIFPLSLYRRSCAPANFGAALIYVLCYVPGQLTLAFMLEASLIELLLAVGALSLSMTLLFLASSSSPSFRFLGPAAEREPKGIVLHFSNLKTDSEKVGNSEYQSARSSGRLISESLLNMIHVLTAISLIGLVATNYSHMRIVSFEDVYDLRFASRDVAANAFVGYLVLWLSVCFIPFYMAYGLVQRSGAYIFVSLVSSVAIYAANGAKSVLILPLTIYGFHLLLNNNRDFLNRLLWTMILFVLVITSIDSPELLMIKAIILVRTLATAGWTMATYYDYFGEHGYTYYTHIGPINSLTGAYPYGDLSLGQLIGLEYSGSIDANFNANFWASDAFAALGLAGVLPVTAALTLVMLVFNHISRSFNPRFVALWSTGFWMTLLNTPLTTSLLSGGGLLIIIFLWNSRVRRRQWNNNNRTVSLK